MFFFNSTLWKTGTLWYINVTRKKNSFSVVKSIEKRWDKEFSLPEGFSELLICLYALRREIQYNISKMEHLLLSPGTQVYRETQSIFLTQLTLLCPNSFSNHIFKILKTEWLYSYWPNDLSSQMPKARDQKLLLRFKMMNQIEADKAAGIWLNCINYQLLRYPFQPDSGFCIFKEMLTLGIRNKITNWPFPSWTLQIEYKIVLS